MRKISHLLFLEWLCLNGFSACQMAYKWKYKSVKRQWCCWIHIVRIAGGQLWRPCVSNMLLWIHKHTQFVFFFSCSFSFIERNEYEDKANVRSNTAHSPNVLILRLANFMTWLDILVIFLLVLLYISHWLLIAWLAIDSFAAPPSVYISNFIQQFDWSNFQTVLFFSHYITFSFSTSPSLSLCVSGWWFEKHHTVIIELIETKKKIHAKFVIRCDVNVKYRRHSSWSSMTTANKRRWPQAESERENCRYWMYDDIWYGILAMWQWLKKYAEKCYIESTHNLYTPNCLIAFRVAVCSVCCYFVCTNQRFAIVSSMPMDLLSVVIFALFFFLDISLRVYFLRAPQFCVDVMPLFWCACVRVCVDYERCADTASLFVVTFFLSFVRWAHISKEFSHLCECVCVYEFFDI